MASEAPSQRRDHWQQLDQFAAFGREQELQKLENADQAVDRICPPVW